MATPEFVYQDPLPLGKDSTKYRLLTKDYVSLTQFEGKDILKVAPEGLTYLANVAIRDVSFLLRTAHLEKVAAILKDPDASQNDRYVALAMLRNADTSSKGILPFCQDTGTAIVFGKKGQQVWTGVKDEEHIAKGIYKTYTEENLRYSQTAPPLVTNKKLYSMPSVAIKSICAGRLVPVSTSSHLLSGAVCE